MAELQQRFEFNAPGKYYVDTSCVHCELCHDIAPEHFTKTRLGEGFVHRQPAATSEFLLCDQALRECPVGAIGANGEEAIR